MSLKTQNELIMLQDAFDLYHKFQEVSDTSAPSPGGPALPALGHAVAGSTGAAISNILIYPLSLIITRLQIQRQLRKKANSPHAQEYISIRDAVQKIYDKEGGFNGFYIGVLSDTSKTIADSFLFFLAYNFLRQSRTRSRSQLKHLPVIDELGVGFLAGAFSKCLTTPIANIVTRKQTASMLTGRCPDLKVDQSTVRIIAKQIYRERGLQGFWSGYSASLILTLNPSMTFSFFETLKRTVLPRNQRDNPTPQATFLLAALSKAMASTITYPFSLAKSRLQAGVVNSDVEPSKENAVKGLAKTEAPNNVFTTIAYIAQNEGIGALYGGLYGEVLKGFFTHGITMIIKDVVHRLVIQLYYAILKLLRRYPTSPHEVAEKAKSQAEKTGKLVGAHVQRAAETAKEGLETITTSNSDSGNGDG